MHARHRSPGNGYRSGSMGMGVGMGMGASRISPDTSARGHGFYNSEHRSFNNRGFGRGQGPPKSFRQPPQPPPQKGDILMEAGRLAAEYLVSKGMLPQSALSGKWQNGSFKKQAGDYQDIRQQEDLVQEGRVSAHSRLGGVASDAGLGRRRFPDDINPRNHVKGRRRGEHYRSYSSEWGGREFGRSLSALDRNRVSPEMDGEDDSVSGHYEEQQVSNDGGDAMQKSGLSGVAPESEEAADRESRLSKHNYPDETGSKASSSSALKEETDGDLSKGSDEPTSLNLGNEEMKDSNHGYETDKQIVPPEDLPINHSVAEGDTSGKDVSDLLMLSKFAHVPTKTRSALSCRSSKVDRVPNNDKEDTSNRGLTKGPYDLVQDGAANVSTAGLLENATHDSNCSNSEIPKAAVVQPSEDVNEENPEYGTVLGKCARSHSFPDRSFVNANENMSRLGLLGFGRSSSVKERGEKRAAECSDISEAGKKPKEWLPSLVTNTDEHLHLNNLSENKGFSQEERDQQVTMASTQDSFVNNCQFSRSGGEEGINYTQEKQLFPGSFKICDLNLMETSDPSDTHRSDPVLTYPSILTPKKEAAQIDIDLSISNSNMCSEYGRRMPDGKQVEIIDLEDDCNPEEKEFDNPQRKMENAFSGPEGFPSHVQNAGDITDVQDNYEGLMLSEFLNNFSNCSSVPDNVNPLQNEMGLDSGEGTLGDDDSIYMSLGEIPLSFIPAWEQPTPREYEKPF